MASELDTPVRQKGTDVMSKRRAYALLAVVHQLEEAVFMLDNLQVGDVDGRVSPLKHALRDAIGKITEDIRALAREEYAKTGEE